MNSKQTSRIRHLLAVVGVTLIFSVIAFTVTHHSQYAHAAGSQTIVNGPLTTDVNGNHLEAYGPEIIKQGSLYYWIGLDWSQVPTSGYQFYGMNCYSSPDLVNWTYVNRVLNQQSSGDLGPGHIVEGNRIIYNSTTHQYVMYSHVADDTNYTNSRVGVSTSNSLCGNYTYQGSYYPLGYHSYDLDLFQDTDGSAYLIANTATSDTNDPSQRTVTIFQLSSDYMTVASVVTTFARATEGFSTIKVNGIYYLLGSDLTGWSTNPNRYTTATSLAGPWSDWTDVAPHSTNTYNTQTQLIFPVIGSQQTSYVFLGSRWNPNNLNDSRLIWLPLNIDSNSRSMYLPNYFDSWSIDTNTGQWSGVANDTDQGLTYSGSSWGYLPNHVTTDYEGDEHYATANGDNVTCTFSGTGVSWIGEKNPGGGTDEIYLDGMDMGSVSAYTVNRETQQVLYGVRGLANQSHTLQIVKTSGSYIEVDGFAIYSGDSLINDNPVPVGMSYSGGSWGYLPTHIATDYQGDEHFATANGDSFSYSFTGTGIDWLGEKNADGGMDEVYLDGTDMGSVSTVTASRETQQVLYGVQGLNPGSHTLQVIKSSGSYIEVDAFAIKA